MSSQWNGTITGLMIIGPTMIGLSRTTQSGCEEPILHLPRHVEMLRVAFGNPGWSSPFEHSRPAHGT